MRYGINLPNGGLTGDPRTAAELAALAEVSGWDGVFLEDYIVWQGHQEVPTYDPWILLAAMALHTTHVRLGITVTPLSRRRPWKVARESVTLDHLSNGRMILGAGLTDQFPGRGRRYLVDRISATGAGRPGCYSQGDRARSTTYRLSAAGSMKKQKKTADYSKKIWPPAVVRPSGCLTVTGQSFIICAVAR